MPKQLTSQQQLLADNAALRARLEQAEQTLSEILSGEADALMIPGMSGAQLFTLQGADQAYRLLIEEMSEGALTLTAEGVILYANRRLAEILKTPLEKVIGSVIHSWVTPENQDALQQLLRHDETQIHRRGEVMLLAGDGTRVPGYLSINLMQMEGMQQGFCMLATDLTEQNKLDAIIADEKSAQQALAAANQSRRVLLSVIEDQKMAEEGLRESEAKFRQLFEGSRDALMIMTPPSWQFTAANKTALQMFGAENVAQFTTLGLWDVSPERQPDGRLSAEKAQAMIAIAVNDGSNFFEWEHRRIDGTSFTADVLLARIEAGGETLIQATVRDISERKQAEKNLAIFRTLLDHSSDGIEVVDPLTLRFLDVNETECHELGYSREEMLAMSTTDIDPAFTPELNEEILKQLRRSGEARFETLHQRKDGSTFPVECSTKMVELDKPYALNIVRDITDRKASQAALQRANRALKTLSTGNLALVRATSEEGLLQEVTNVIVEQGGYIQAVVDYAEDAPGKGIIPMAWSGYEGEHYWAEQLSWDDTVRGQLPIAKAIRSGKTQVCHDIAGDPAFKPWQESAVERGYVSNIALPLSDGKRTFGGLSIYSSESSAFDDEEVRLLEELANDLAYGIVTLRTRKEHEQHTAILRQSLEQSIQTIAATVEARDPYTAGHQRRVSELAVAIAREMGLPQEQINGLHLAAIIHDLGKIRVPAEILSKPGKLTDSEFGMIKDHPQAGYDILKDVKFPWPIAAIVWQHHERLDGSGYPQGLKGDQILPESRIIAVADVVEAISSHRPYRASLGIETALAEIKRGSGSGSAYDPEVVDACVKLFAEKEFAFSSQ